MTTYRAAFGPAVLSTCTTTKHTAGDSAASSRRVFKRDVTSNHSPRPGLSLMGGAGSSPSKGTGASHKGASASSNTNANKKNKAPAAPAAKAASKPAPKHPPSSASAAASKASISAKPAANSKAKSGSKSASSTPKSTPSHPIVSDDVRRAGDELDAIVPEPERYDAATAKAAHAALVSRLMAYPKDKLGIPRIDVRDAGLAALGIHALVASAPSLVARFHALAGAGQFEIGNLELLRNAALCAIYCHAQAEAEGAFQVTEVRVPPAIYEAACALEKKMQELLEYKFKRDPQIKPLLDALSPGTGYRDVAGDLNGYADIYELRAAEVASDGTLFDKSDVAEARRLSGEIMAHVVKGMSPKAQAAYGMMQRAWLLLSEVHAEVVAAGLFLLRYDPDRATRFPSLYAVARALKARARKASSDAATPAPADKAPVPA